MDSPENDPDPNADHSPALQDSSLFNYLSTLSPLTTLKQTYIQKPLRTSSIPPSPTVFTSPHINSQRGRSFLKRQYVNSFAPELPSEYNDNTKILVAGSDKSDLCQLYANQSTVQLTSCTQKECGNKGSGQMHPQSPLGSVDEFLADALEGCVNSMDSPDLYSKKDTEASQGMPSAFSSPKEAALETVAANNDLGNAVWNATETVETALATLPEEVHKDAQDQNSSDHVEQLWSEREKRAHRTEQKDGVKPNNEWLDIVSKSVDDSIDADLQTGYASGKQNNQLLVNHASNKFSSLVSSNKDSDIAETEKLMPLHSSGLQHNGTKDVMPTPAESGHLGAWNYGQRWLPESFQILPVDGINNENFRALSRGTFEKNQIPNDCKEASEQQRGMCRRLQFDAEEACRKSIENNTSSWNSVNIAPNAMTPAGTTDPEATSTCHADSFTTSDNKQVVNFFCQSSSRLSFYPLETPETHNNKVDTSIRDNRSSCIPSAIGLHLNSIGNAVTVSSVSNSQLARKDYGNSSTENLLSGTSFPLSEDSKGWLIPYENQMPISQDPCRLEYSQMSPKQKRKRDSNTFEKEGCKRCNCKKSKCLKLYCDCFAAGVYCAEPCTCLECFNRPEYEDTVLGTRQQIESRNPLAFAPKIVRRATESPQNSGEDNDRKTPGSGRHKRGCNCKKSRCLKKYCECYQAGVGCSDGCRCEGCKNVFGRKEEMELLAAGDERWEDASDGKMENDILQLEQRHSDISPLTPMFQFSNHGRDIHKYHHPIRRYPASPSESEVSILSPYGKSPESSHMSDRNCSLNKGSSVGLVLHDQELDYKIAGKVYPFSSRWDVLPDIHDLRPPLQHIQSRATAAVASGILYSSKDSRHELCQENGSLSGGSLRWHSSPVTPNVHFGGSKFVLDSDSDNRLYNILEDETPHKLKDNHSPMEAVKTSSPNKKRVSPPHDYLQELRGSSSSPGLRGGRKFILQSVPSFPPLTPFSEPKDSEK